MNWQLSAPQWFFIVMVIFGVIGFQRGWRREIISLAFILTGILFLAFGQLGLAQFVFVNLPRAIQALLTGATETQPAPTISASDARVGILTAITFIVIVALGYIVSQRVGPKYTGMPERIWGILPAAISGYAILTSVFGGNSFFKLNVSALNQNLASGYLLVIFIVVVAVIIVALIAASSKKAPPPKPK